MPLATAPRSRSSRAGSPRSRPTPPPSTSLRASALRSRRSRFTRSCRGQLITGAESLQLRHDLTGGHGEGTASADYLWWPPHKVSGRYLAAWLAHEMPRADPEPPEARSTSSSR